ncbi:hypothetical protein DFH08DRAFT_822329 [Mycena albidolilacea]|uniref:Uncharacterized protein n=1 Tax=Mycena albidolilacea TaxID=1033008 RepID=A0AAD6Z8J5_9AGAR|nr:hypothetical protein DFH08DRAFT_822329 [Mycena albidolilacea]
MAWLRILHGMPIRHLWAPPQLGRLPMRVAMYFPTPSAAAVDRSLFHRPVPAPFADAVRAAQLPLELVLRTPLRLTHKDEAGRSTRTAAEPDDASDLPYARVDASWSLWEAAGSALASSAFGKIKGLKGFALCRRVECIPPMHPGTLHCYLGWRGAAPAHVLVDSGRHASLSWGRELDAAARLSLFPWQRGGICYALIMCIRMPSGVEEANIWLEVIARLPLWRAHMPSARTGVAPALRLGPRVWGWTSHSTSHLPVGELFTETQMLTLTSFTPWGHRKGRSWWARLYQRPACYRSGMLLVMVYPPASSTFPSPTPLHLLITRPALFVSIARFLPLISVAPPDPTASNFLFRNPSVDDSHPLSRRRVEAHPYWRAPGVRDAPGLASSREATKPKPRLDKPSQAKSLASRGLGLGLGVTEAQAHGSSRGLEGPRRGQNDGTAPILNCDKLVDGQHYRAVQQYLQGRRRTMCGELNIFSVFPFGYSKSALVDDTGCDDEEDADDDGKEDDDKEKSWDDLLEEDPDNYDPDYDMDI